MNLQDPEAGVGLATVTVTGAEVVALPAASRATAVRVYEPLATAVVFAGTAYGAVVFSAPMSMPLCLNCTPTTPTSSEARATTGTVPQRVAPDGGETMATVGGVVSLWAAQGKAAASKSAIVNARSASVMALRPAVAQATRNLMVPPFACAEFSALAPCHPPYSHGDSAMVNGLTWSRHSASTTRRITTT